MNAKVLKYVLIIAWYVSSLAVTYLIYHAFFQQMKSPWSFAVGGLICVVVAAFLFWVYLYVKAFRNPDVQAATKLNMSILRYNKYQKIWKEIKIIQNSKKNSEEARKEINALLITQVPNIEEWHRFEEYQTEMAMSQQKCEN